MTTYIACRKCLLAGCCCSVLLRGHVVVIRKREAAEDVAALAAAHAAGETMGRKGNMDLSFLRQVRRFYAASISVYVLTLLEGARYMVAPDAAAALHLKRGLVLIQNGGTRGHVARWQ